MKKLIAVLMLLGMTLFILDDAFARGRSGGGRSGSGMGRSSRGKSRGSSRGKDAKRDRDRADRENRDGFLGDSRDDAE